ncbi:MAG: acetyl-CoA carboxylase biotin carboxyl carrier protein subunit [Chloroflexi bacterium]|nr:acetyl-CoA carboxylase biotin carboxyl carrier protein subunit [Chloroflexota bacterium]
MKKLRVTVEGETYEVEVEEVAEVAEAPATRQSESRGTAQWLPPVAEGAVLAPMPGTVMMINVSRGDIVKVGDTLLVMESMKIETPIASPRAGRVKDVLVTAGQFVRTRQPMVMMNVE